MSRFRSFAEGNETEDIASDQHLIFGLGAQRFATRLLSVREVTEARPCEPIPNALAHVLGMTDLRGEIVCVVDLRLLLKKDRACETGQAIVIADTKSGPMGAAVDDLYGVIDIPADSILSEPGSNARTESNHTLGVARLDSTLVTIVDLYQILSTCPVLGL